MIKSLAVLGCGNMNSALVKGIWKERKDLLVHTYTPSFSRAEKLAMETSGTAYKNPNDIPEVDAYLIGCKPQQFDQLVAEFKGKIGKDKIIISILAGVKADRISEKLGNRKVVRIMPNTPTLVSKGVSLLYSSEFMDIDEKREVEDLISKTSQVYSFEDEEMVEKLSGLTGSGPAYVFELARILAKKAMSFGVGEEDAYSMVKRLIYGSALLMEESKESPVTLRENVTSKKGITFEALKVLEEGGQEKLYSDAIDAAYKRARELEDQES